MRKLFLFTLLTLSVGLWAQDINAVKFVQGQTTDWYLLASNPEVTFDANQNPVINGKTYDLALGAVETTFGTASEDIWYTVRTDGAAGKWNAICLEHNITAMDGATFWIVSGQNATSFILDEVIEPQAGYGYLIRFTKPELKVQYGNDYEESPVEAAAGNPIQGTYVQIDAAETNVLNGNYVVYNNQLCLVEGWVGLLAHRAYVVADLVPDDVPQQVPGRARAYMAKPKETPTKLNRLTDSPINRFNKFIINGQFVIIKDGREYNALGAKIK